MLASPTHDEVLKQRPVHTGLVVFFLAVGVTVAAVAHGEHPFPRPELALFIVLGIAAEVFPTRFSRSLAFGASESVYLLALAALGPISAILVAVTGQIAGWLASRYRVVPLLVNVVGVAWPILVAGLVFDALSPADVGDRTPQFLGALGAATLVAMTLNPVVVLPLMSLLDRAPLRTLARQLATLAPALGFQFLFVLVTAGVYARLGFEAVAFAAVVVAAFLYMLHLLVQARDRTREYANLSWGLLSGLIRTLDARDTRAARHCAAVARFSRDIAEHVGMSPKEQELAHTSGLLHDIGRFALSDRVMDRGTRLEPDDWRAIRRHPELGADLLKDIGVYGPVAAIIRAHHERPDGRGYPDGLSGTQIPEIAKVVAVAEVYDTLTAPDTYRTPMTSFEALNELRRVSGTQLDGRYVEALADLLAGQGTDYRHADAADFDAELAIERRMNEAAAP